LEAYLDSLDRPLRYNGMSSVVIVRGAGTRLTNFRLGGLLVSGGTRPDDDFHGVLAGQAMLNVIHGTVVFGRELNDGRSEPPTRSPPAGSTITIGRRSSSLNVDEGLPTSGHRVESAHLSTLLPSGSVSYLTGPTHLESR